MKVNRHSCPHCGQHVVIENAPAGTAVNCPNCGMDFALAAQPARKGLLTSPVYWGVVLVAVGAIVVTIAVRDKRKTRLPEIAVVKPAPKGITAAPDLPLEGRSLDAWVEAVDVDFSDSEMKHAREVLKQAAPAIIPEIIAILGDPKTKPRHRGNAAQALGWAGKNDGPEVEALWDALKDQQHYVRYSACYSLRRLRVNSQRLVPKLIEMLDDPDSYVRRGAADNLGLIGEPARGAIPILQKLLNDDEQRTRDRAAQAIKRLEATKPPNQNSTQSERPPFKP